MVAHIFLGSKRKRSSFDGISPHSVLGRSVAINQFYTLITDTANTDYAGWPNFLESLDFSDATSSVGKVVAQMAYRPKIAPLKTPPGKNK